MSLVAEKEMEHIGESKGMEDHDFDLVHELDKRLSAIWRYDQYTANADGNPSLQRFWRDLKSQEQENVKRLKEFISKEIEKGCF